MAHYDRNADVAFLEFDASQPGELFADERPWGLILKHRSSDKVAGTELWRASEHLPQDLLDALPEPAAEAASVPLEADPVAD